MGGSFCTEGMYWAWTPETGTPPAADAVAAAVAPDAAATVVVILVGTTEVMVTFRGGYARRAWVVTTAGVLGVAELVLWGFVMGVVVGAVEVVVV